ncbi:MAG TPA: peptide deformylase [Polyangia bacterium]|nr:peptide deformylase [Polyangia bacterium]
MSDAPVTAPIVQAGDPVLRGQARLVRPDEFGKPAFEALVAVMRDTMRAAPGVGLAAPQIGVPLQLAVIEDRPDYQARLDAAELAEREREPIAFHVIANPRLTILDGGDIEFYEGCLSVDGYLAKVARARRVRVEALDERGAPVVIEARGWHARILQHEIDHLLGTLYIDRMTPRTLTTHDNYARFAARADEE